MKFFIDSGDIGEIREAAAMGAYRLTQVGRIVRHIVYPATYQGLRSRHTIGR